MTKEEAPELKEGTVLYHVVCTVDGLVKLDDTWQTNELYVKDQGARRSERNQGRISVAHGTMDNGGRHFVSCSDLENWYKKEDLPAAMLKMAEKALPQKLEAARIALANAQAEFDRVSKLEPKDLIITSANAGNTPTIYNQGS